MTTNNTMLIALAQAARMNRIVVWPSAEDYSFGRIGHFELFTDENGDYLRASLDGGEQVEVMHVRDFSLYTYDLFDPAGRAAVREYLRRKLKAALAAAEAEAQETHAQCEGE